MDNSAFSEDFASARTKFVSAATEMGGTVSTYAYPEQGPNGETLSTDVAWVGPNTASKVFVTVSGTHGVEGFCGSGAQIDWLKRAEKLPEDTAVMLVHAINPYGFAWHRRVTHENIDLNRNWVNFDEPLPENAAYDEIADALAPAQWTIDSREQSMQELKQFIVTHGMPKFVAAVSVGQYRHPKGLFYSGTKPSVARQTLTTIFSDHLADARRIAIIDYHSGLGPPGFGEQMVIAPTESDQFGRARRIFGAAVKSVVAGNSASAKIQGGWTGAAMDLLPHAEVTAIALEFGTVNEMVVLEALRADNWLHAYGDPTSTEAHAIRTAVRNAFYIDDDVWRGMVLGQSLIACRQALAGLQ